MLIEMIKGMELAGEKLFLEDLFDFIEDWNEPTDAQEN